MSKKIYVGNLPYSITDDELREMFSKFGEVIFADIITDKYTKQSKGFGFVEMKDDKSAAEAIKKLDSTDIDDRKIVVNEARPREERMNYNNNNASNGHYHNKSRGRGKRF